MTRLVSGPPAAPPAAPSRCGDQLRDRLRDRLRDPPPLPGGGSKRSVADALRPRVRGIKWIADPLGLSPSGLALTMSPSCNGFEATDLMQIHASTQTKNLMQSDMI